MLRSFKHLKGFFVKQIHCIRIDSPVQTRSPRKPGHYADSFLGTGTSYSRFSMIHVCIIHSQFSILAQLLQACLSTPLASWYMLVERKLIIIAA